jgi:hypothetical protein
MAAKKKVAKKAAAPARGAGKKKKAVASGEMIISKSRTKNAVSKCKVASDFYAALDGKVREMLKAAEARAQANKRGTVRPQDL